jgi:ATP-dependent Lon protease
VTNTNEEYQMGSKDAYTEIRDTLEPLVIFFSYEFDEIIHGRYIKAGNGWKIFLGRKLDIFQKTRGRYDIAEVYQEQWQCKACEITLLKNS